MRGSGRPARPIKRKATPMARRDAGTPAKNRPRQARQANFGSVRGGAGCGIDRSVRGAANVKAMEMHLVRRPVKGGPARIRRKEMVAQRYRAGGPGVPWTPGRRPPHRNGGTFGSFSHERTTIIREVGKKMAAELSRQVSCKATPAKANKEKMQRWRRGWARGIPQAGRCRKAR